MVKQDFCRLDEDNERIDTMIENEVLNNMKRGNHD